MGKIEYEYWWKNGRLGRGKVEYRFNTTMGNGTFKGFVHRGYSRVVSELLPFRDMFKNLTLALFNHLL